MFSQDGNKRKAPALIDIPQKVKKQKLEPQAKLPPHLEEFMKSMPKMNKATIAKVCWQHIYGIEEKGECYGCGSEIVKGMPATELSHIIPASLGGPLQAWNLVPLCTNCNRYQGKLNMIEYISSKYDVKIHLKEMLLLLYIAFKDKYELLNNSFTQVHPDLIYNIAVNVYCIDGNLSKEHLILDNVDVAKINLCNRLPPLDKIKLIRTRNFMDIVKDTINPKQNNELIKNSTPIIANTSSPEKPDKNLYKKFCNDIKEYDENSAWKLFYGNSNLGECLGCYHSLEQNNSNIVHISKKNNAKYNWNIIPLCRTCSNAYSEQNNLIDWLGNSQKYNNIKELLLLIMLNYRKNLITYDKKFELFPHDKQLICRLAERLYNAANVSQYFECIELKSEDVFAVVYSETRPNWTDKVNIIHNRNWLRKTLDDNLRQKKWIHRSNNRVNRVQNRPQNLVQSHRLNSSRQILPKPRANSNRFR